MVRKNKPTITHTVEDQDGIVGFETKKKVTAIGNSGHVTLPIQLVGKEVSIKYLRDYEIPTLDIPDSITMEKKNEK